MTKPLSEVPTQLRGLVEQFRREGMHAGNAGHPPTACPYSMSNAVTAVDVKAQVRARGWWMEGYELAKAERTGPVKTKRRRA